MLQLFAVDDATKSARPLAAHLNPHLELTFRAKKSVPGLMQHLAVKWAGAVARLPKTPARRRADAAVYPFESASAAEAKGAWNASHDGATATDIFDANRPPRDVPRAPWLGAGRAGGVCPHLAPPPPPVHQDSVLGGGGRSRGGGGGSPKNLRRASAPPRRCTSRTTRSATLNASSGAFSSGRDVRRRVRRRSRHIRVRVQKDPWPRLHLRRRPRRRGALRRAAGDARGGRRRSRHESGVAPTGTRSGARTTTTARSAARASRRRRLPSGRSR